MNWTKLRGLDRRSPLTAVAQSTEWMGQMFSKNAFVASILLITATVFTWFLTFGTARFFEKNSHPGPVYDSIAAHLRHGDLQVDREAIGSEAFVVGNHTFTYFGPVPALPRIVLNAIVPSMYGRWDRLFVLIVLLSTVCTVVCLFRNLRFWFPPSQLNTSTHRSTEAFVAVASGLGCTSVFLSSGAFVYHEAIGWGTLFALLSAVHLMKFWRSGRTWSFSLATVCAILAFFSRVTAGVGPLGLVLGVGILHTLPKDSLKFLSRLLAGQMLLPHIGRRIIASIAFGSLSFALLIFVGSNHARFNTWFDNVPIRYHVAYSPERLQHTNGSLINFGLAAQNMEAYIWHPSINRVELFPWIAFDEGWVNQAPGLNYDLVEPLASMAVSMPALLILSILGLAHSAWRSGRDGRPLLLSIALLGNGCALLGGAFLSERYLHDWMPGMLTAACIGLLLIERLPYFRLAIMACWLLLLWNLLVMFSLTFIYQRELGYDSFPSQRRFQLDSISYHITALVKSVGGDYEPPIPVITSLGPSETRIKRTFNRLGDGSSAISVSGYGFDRGSEIVANDWVLPTTFGNARWLTATVPEDLFGSEGTITFRVRTCSGVYSRTKEFRVVR